MERGNLCIGVKGTLQMGSPHKKLSTKTVHRGGSACTSEEVAERQWSEGAELSVLTISQPWKWEELHCIRQSCLDFKVTNEGHEIGL